MKTLLIAPMAALALAGCAGFQYGEPGAGGTRTAGQAVDDATIGTRLKAALAADPELSALKINVDTLQGNVKLKGQVKSMKEWRKAGELARSIDGVKSVDNQLVISG
ncbi:BON domain-containing protein [Ramlibacter sp.]|uniref:BON domain-containing protein n=1 Tax=Ramlibacter sp. TaxID=1917967 RepID=UPI002FC6D109